MDCFQFCLDFAFKFKLRRYSVVRVHALRVMCREAPDEHGRLDGAARTVQRCWRGCRVRMLIHVAGGVFRTTTRPTLNHFQSLPPRLRVGMSVHPVDSLCFEFGEALVGNDPGAWHGGCGTTPRPAPARCRACSPAWASPTSPTSSPRSILSWTTSRQGGRGEGGDAIKHSTNVQSRTSCCARLY